MNQPARHLSTLGFIAIILGIVGAGLGVVMIITTSISAQSRELTALEQRADELAYEQEALATQLESVSSTASLALRATQLGMVPNPYPAFLDLSDGTIIGDPTPVTGDELPQLRGRPPQVEEVPPAPDTGVDTTPQGTSPVAEPSVAAAAEPGGEG